MDTDTPDDISAIYESAIKNLTEVIRVDPEILQAYYSRGHAHTKMGNHHLAIDDYTQAIRIDPEYATAYYTRA